MNGRSRIGDEGSITALVVVDHHNIFKIVHWGIIQTGGSIWNLVRAQFIVCSHRLLTIIFRYAVIIVSTFDTSGSLLQKYLPDLNNFYKWNFLNGAR